MKVEQSNPKLKWQIWTENLYEIPDELKEAFDDTCMKLQGILDEIYKTIPSMSRLQNTARVRHTYGGKGELVLDAAIYLSLPVGICWSCYECKRTFTDVPAARSRTVGDHYAEKNVYTCEECASYWYGNENYGKEKPEHLKPKR